MVYLDYGYVVRYRGCNTLPILCITFTTQLQYVTFVLVRYCGYSTLLLLQYNSVVTVRDCGYTYSTLPWL